MNGKYKKYKIKEIAKSMSDAPFGSNLKNTDYRDEGILILQGKNIQGRSCDWSEKRFISKGKFDTLKKHQVKVGELIFPKVGTIGKVGILTPYKNDSDYVLSTNTMKLEVNESIANRDYVYYYFANPSVAQYINQIGSNSVQPVFNFTSLKEFEISLPSLSTQRRIAAILTALDDKIELNRRMNATLEGIAQALWGEWFGKYAGGEEELQEGWRWGKLGDVAQTKKGQIKPDEMTDELQYVGLEHIARKSLSLTDSGTAGKLESNKFRFSKGDLLFGKLRPYFHKVCIAPFDGVCSTDILVIKPKEAAWFAFVVFHFFSDELISFTTATADGTRMPRTSWGDLANFEIAIPPKPLALTFNEFAKHIFEKMIENNQESHTLTSLRDALLPQLMRGEINPS